MTAREPRAHWRYRPVWTGWALLACMGVGLMAVEHGDPVVGGVVMGLAVVAIAIWLAVDVVGGPRR